MVSWLVGRFDAAAAAAAMPLAAAEEQGQPLFERLDPESRAKVVMALLGLVLVGGALVLLTIAGGRYMRRIARSAPRKTPSHEDDWYRKPLVPKDPPRPPDGDPE